MSIDLGQERARAVRALDELLSGIAEARRDLEQAQARLLLASRGIRIRQRVLEAALKLLAADPKASLAPRPKPNPRPRLKPLDDLPLTPREREIMERLRGGR
ncbi:MAG: hypothetical protein KatS3mg070_2301 [Meiothermus sp.]|uniref:hypothetical protein n=1 Tax=Meiothermus sp. TaxID=1955249 RepID=UPI0021DE46B2|nr:hypothetical protein [Meiothermus sp.]GIW28938.1 MAG: hypothetical protein KatS3mg070_2301 [Meiothermus sp.]